MLVGVDEQRKELEISKGGGKKKKKGGEPVPDMHKIPCDLTCCLNHDLLPLPRERS